MIRDPREISARALGSVGCPYQHLGRDPRRAIDCIGLMIHSYGFGESFSTTFARYSKADNGYYANKRWYRTPATDLIQAATDLRRELDQYFESCRTPRQGALLLMRCKLKKETQIAFDHVAICTDRQGGVVHANLREGVVIDYYNRLEKSVVEILQPR